MKKFRVTRYQIPIDKKKYCLEGKIRIVLLSDLHNESYGKNNDVLIQEIHRQKPDLIAAVGVDGNEGYVRAEELSADYDVQPDEIVLIPLYDVDGVEIDSFALNSMKKG